MKFDETQIHEIRELRIDIERIAKQYDWPLGVRKSFDEANEALRVAGSQTCLALGHGEFGI